eukprot:TRINITY_DN28714_c0_g1_i1.p1 TRINITY_DN28714_c0_g1~~TRINITY_DN28714_c0_g1_i1.p1  ORF type:complete len:636 (-),score=120.26 TRINITY_DN28714_c0_g1_i1:103-2010(-)
MAGLANRALQQPEELVRCNCAVSVEVGGKALRPEKSKAKTRTVHVLKARTGIFLRAPGFTRDVTISMSDLRTLVDSKIEQGRLGFVAKDGMQLVLSEAQPTQLHAIIRALNGEASPAQRTEPKPAGVGEGSQDRREAILRALKEGEGAGPKAGKDTHGRPAATPVKLARTGESSGPKAQASSVEPGKINLGEMPHMVLQELVAFLATDLFGLLGETCRALEEMTVAKGPTLRLARAYRNSAPPSLVVRRVQRQTNLRVLDLSGFEALTAGASKELAEALATNADLRLHTLSLRGCKALSDASVRRLLSSCPSLEILDLLEIPRLSNKALQAPLPRLRVLAAGSLGRAVTEKSQSEGAGFRTGRLDVGGGGSLAAAVHQSSHKACVSSLFTSFVFRELLSSTDTANGKSSEAPGASKASRPLTHLMFGHCTSIEVLPHLPASLLHLDLRGASLQAPANAEQHWRPLSNCPQLEALNLAGNVLLGSGAVLACISSLPSRTQLRALDISDTRPDAVLFSSLPTQASALTHFRACNSMALRNAELAELLRRLAALEVLDVGGCGSLEFPLSDLVPAAATSAAAALAPKLRHLGLARTALVGAHIDYTRRALARIAPLAKAFPISFDLFHAYDELPPAWL